MGHAMRDKLPKTDQQYHSAGQAIPMLARRPQKILLKGKQAQILKLHDMHPPPQSQAIIPRVRMEYGRKLNGNTGSSENLEQATAELHKFKGTFAHKTYFLFLFCFLCSFVVWFYFAS